MISLLLRALALLPETWIEVLVMMQVYVVAVVYIVKELLFEATNKGIKRRLENDIQKSQAFRSARNKTVLVTGADGTIGKEVVKRLLRYEFTIHALVGDRKKAEELFLFLDGSHFPLTVYQVDLANPSEVAKFARGFVTRYTEINALIFCAGTMLSPPKFIDDIETHMRVNVLSQFLLLRLLDPILALDARVAALSSATARVAFCPSSLLQQDPLTYYVGPYEAYCFSKLVLSTFVEELSRRRSQNLISMHPGVVPGGLYRHTNSFTKFVTVLILPYLLRSAAFSALLILHTTFRDDQINGCYYEDCAPKTLRSGFSEQDKSAIFECVQRQVEEWARAED